MVTRYEQQLERAARAERLKELADELHARSLRVPFWQRDDSGTEIILRDMNERPLVTFHGPYGDDLARYFNAHGRTSRMALADLIRDVVRSDEWVPGREAAVKLLREMGQEHKPERYRPR